MIEPKNKNKLTFATIEVNAGLKKAIALSRADIIGELKESGMKAAARRLPDLGEVEPRGGGKRRQEVRGLQRRRRRAGHVQRPPDPFRLCRPGVRRHDHRRSGYRSDEGIVYLRAEYTYLVAHLEDALAKGRAAVCWARISWARRASTSTFTCTWAPAPTFAARKPR
jgi:hypothetical protein